jgi:hypothetical protein
MTRMLFVTSASAVNNIVSLTSSNVSACITVPKFRVNESGGFIEKVFSVGLLSITLSNGLSTRSIVLHLPSDSPTLSIVNVVCTKCSRILTI